MIHWLFLCLYIAGFFLIGDTISGILRLEFNSWVERLGLAFVIGTGILALLFFYFSLFHVFTGRLFLLIVYAVFALLYSIFHPPFFLYSAKHKKHLVIIGVIIFLFFIFFAMAAVMVPINAGDALSIWGMKAKMLFYNGVYCIRNQKLIIPHLSYPLLVPILESEFYHLINNIDDRVIKLIHS